MKRKIVILSHLSKKRQADVKALERICKEHDRTGSEAYLSNDLNFRKSFKCFYLCYEANELIGFLTLFAPEYGEAEVNAFTRPDKRHSGVFKELLAAACEELGDWDIKRVIYVLEPVSRDAVAMAKHIGAQKEYSELLMVLSDRKNLPCGDEFRLEETESGMHDGVAAFELIRRSDACGQDTGAVQAGKTGEKVGEVYLNVGDRVCFIFGVEIKTGERGRGCGQALMELLLERIEEQYHGKTVKLEVSDTNRAACHIYEKAGFVIETRIDYYT